MSVKQSAQTFETLLVKLQVIFPDSERRRKIPWHESTLRTVTSIGGRPRSSVGSCVSMRLSPTMWARRH
jgi:hypothetical protein